MTRPLDPNSAAGRMRTHVRRLIQQHREAGTIPTNSRFLYYELVQMGVAKKNTVKVVNGKEKKVRGDLPVINALTQLRESGEVDWDEISDESRRLYDFTGGR